MTQIILVVDAAPFRGRVLTSCEHSIVRMVGVIDASLGCYTEMMSI